MGEPVLRLVIPESAGGPGQASRRPVGSQPAVADVAPSEGAANGATNTATDGATARANNPVGTPEAGAINGATSTATEIAADPGPEVADDARALPELQPIGRPMTARERAARLARHWLAAAREDAMRPGELLHAALHGKGESLAEIHAYAISRAWVPDGYEGPLAPALGAVYSHTIAKGGAALGLSIAWVTARALRLAVFLLVTGVLTVLITVFS